ncbi:hypothetical protein V5O48_014880 [Marasmius crinis-equi]|uniref:Mid2 domain-containing protein n=1 Tax=Marasmius crinis-equi TaxID=585013 RepID=A0ABR3EW22_9AGAR
MKLRSPLLLLCHSFYFTPSWSFTVTGLPQQVTQQQIATLAWSRTERDPTTFLIAKTGSPDRIAGAIQLTSVGQEQKSGIMTVTFHDIEVVSVAAYDLSRIEYDAILNPNPIQQPRPSPFFVDGQHPINIAASGSRTTPATPASTPSVSIPITTSATTQMTQTNFPSGPTEGSASSSSTSHQPDTQSGSAEGSSQQPAMGTRSPSSSSGQTDTGSQTTLVPTRTNNGSGGGKSSSTEIIFPTNSQGGPTTPSGNKDRGLMIGIIIGSLVVLLIPIGFTVWRRIRSRRRQLTVNDVATSPYVETENDKVARGCSTRRRAEHRQSKPDYGPEQHQPNTNIGREHHESGTVAPGPAESLTPPPRELPRVRVHEDGGWRPAPASESSGSCIDIPPRYEDAIR